MISAPLLLVDDSPDDVALTLRAFRRAQFANEIIVATDGQRALDLLLPPGGERGLRPAIVLLDLHMPRVDGLEVLRRLRADARTKLLPVVILTTSSEERDRLASYTLGANSFVAKPVVMSEFLEAIRLLSLYWFVVNLPPPPPSPDDDHTGAGGPR